MFAMSETHQAEAERAATTGSSVVARRSEPQSPRGEDSAASEVYGSENLPVLIRLPDLSSAMTVEPIDSVERSEDPVESQPAPVPEDTGAAVTVAGGARAAGERNRWRGRRSARRAEKKATPSWLRGAGQLALATALAGILFVIIVTFQERHRGARDDAPDAKSSSVAGPAVDFGPPVLEPATNAQAEENDVPLPLQSADGSGSTLQGVRPAAVPPTEAPSFPSDVELSATAPQPSARIARKPEPQRAGPLVPRSAPTYPYPSTGIAPTTVEANIIRPPRAERWPGAMPPAGGRAAMPARPNVPIQPNNGSSAYGPTYERSGSGLY